MRTIWFRTSVVCLVAALGCNRGKLESTTSQPDAASDGSDSDDGGDAPLPEPQVPQPPAGIPEEPEGPLVVPPKLMLITPDEISTNAEDSVTVAWQVPTRGTPQAGWTVYYVPRGQTLDVVSHKVATVSDNEATSVRVSGLPRGAFGKLVVAAHYTDGDDDLSADGRMVWTPFGGVNADHVNKINWIYGPIGSDMAVFSDKFSLVWGMYYNPDFAAVYDKVPSKVEEPRFIWNSRWISGFATTTDGYQDGVQLWTDGIGKFSMSTSQGGIRLFNRLPLDPANVTRDLTIGNGAVNASKVGSSGHFCYDASVDRSFLSDPARNRILVFEGWPSEDNPEADFVLGQGDFDTFTANAGGASAARMSIASSGGGLHCHNGMLALADRSNNRVLVWLSPITSNGQAADFVAGQSTASAVGANGAGGIDKGGMSLPSSVLLLPKVGGGYALVVADYGNKRVLEWDTIPAPTLSAQFAGDFSQVYGQPSRSANSANTSPVTAAGLACAKALYPEISAQGEIKPDVFWVNDAHYSVSNNSRTVKFRRTQSEAIDVYGQASLTVNASNYLKRPFYWNQQTTGRFSSIDTTTGQISAGDVTWKSIDDSYAKEPDYNLAARSTAFVSGYLWASNGDRVLGYTATTPSDVSQASTASLVLGRKTLANAANGAVPDTFEYKLSNVNELKVSGANLLALDSHRVVIWNVSTPSDHKAIDVVVGQPDKTTNAANQGGRSAATLSSPFAFNLHNGKLLVADSGNNRVLIWNTIPTTSGAAADVILGQLTGDTATSGTDLGGMSAPKGVTVVNGKLLVSDSENGRILVWDSVPTETGTPANRAIDILGLSRFELPSWVNANALKPRYIEVAAGKVFIEQFGRLLVMPDIFTLNVD